MAYSPGQNYGLFVPTNNIWDVVELQNLDVQSPEFIELLVRMYQNLGLMATVLNLKESAYYDVNRPFVNGQLFFPNPALNSASATTPIFRQVYRLVVNFGQLPNNSTTSVAHNLTIGPNTTFTRIYGTASDTTDNLYIPIPYASASAVADNIELNVDATNVNVTTGSDRTNFTTTYIILEYITS